MFVDQLYLELFVEYYRIYCRIIKGFYFIEEKIMLLLSEVLKWVFCLGVEVVRDGLYRCI